MNWKRAGAVLVVRNGCARRRRRLAVFPLHYNQRYPTFACFIGARCAYARLQNKFDINVQTFADFSSLDIGEIVSYAGITVWTRFHEHRVQNAAVASISLVAVVTCLSQVSV